MSRAPLQQILTAITLLAPGLYAGRLFSELLGPGLLGVIMLTLFTTAVGTYTLRRRHGNQPLWLLLPLYVYVFYPALHPAFGVATGAVTLVAALLVPQSRLQSLLAPLSPRLLAALILLLSFVLYALTLSPDLLPADNGELQLVAAELGVAHPPGFALYTVLAHLATRLPIGASPAFRANLLSALIAAATLALLYLSAVRLTGSRFAGLVGALALGSATTFWAQATTANVRMLTAFFAALAIYLLILIRERLAMPLGHAGPQTRATVLSTNHLLFFFALTLSLGVTHHASLLFMGLIFALALLWFDPALLRQPSRWRWPAAGLLLGLLPLLYFPLRALTAGDVRGASAELATLPGFLQHVLALGFRGDLFAFTSPQELWARLLVMGNVMTFQFHWLLLAGMLLGFALLLRRRAKMALTLGAAFALHTLVTATYRAPQTVEYMLPAYLPAALLLAAAAQPARPRIPSEPSRNPLAPAIPALLAALLLVTAIAQGRQRYPSFRELRMEFSARSYAETIMQEAPENSVVLAGWHWATPLWYLQEVQGLRPDLDVHYVFPTAEPYGQTWARRIAENLARGAPVVATHFDAEAYGELPPYEPLGDAFLYPREPRRSLPAGFTPLEATLGDQVELLGYRLQDGPLAPLEESTVTVAWRPITGADLPALTLFAHLVRVDDGAIYAQQDVPVLPTPGGITLTQLRFTPRLAAQPGDYVLYVGAYETGSGNPLLAGDGAARTLLETAPLQAMERPPFTANRLHAPPLAREQWLVGYDWDHTLAPQSRLYLHWQTPQGYVTEAIDNPPPGSLLPPIYGPWGLQWQRPALRSAARQYYVPLAAGIVWTGAPGLAGKTPPAGDTVPLTQYFAAGRALQQDLVVSVRLVGYEPDGVHWAWWDLHDAVPALGAIPTLKWIDGSQIRDPHFLAVSPVAPTGQQLGALVTLYDAFTQQSVPILDARITDHYLGIPLGSGNVR